MSAELHSLKMERVINPKKIHETIYIYIKSENLLKHLDSAPAVPIQAQNTKHLIQERIEN